MFFLSNTVSLPTYKIKISYLYNIIKKLLRIALLDKKSTLFEKAYLQINVIYSGLYTTGVSCPGRDGVTVF